jgi:hypothetical protein
MRLLNSRKSHFHPIFAARLAAFHPALRADFMAVAYDPTPVWSHFIRTLKIQRPSNRARKPRKTPIRSQLAVAKGNYGRTPT